MDLLLVEEPTPWSVAIATTLAMAVLMVGAGLLVVGVAKRAADGRTGRNPYAGIRTSATMSSDEAWDAAHMAGRKLTVLGGWLAVLSGVASIPVALLLWSLGASADWVTLGAIVVSAGLGTVGVLGLVVAGAVKGHRAAVEVRASVGDQQR